MHYLVSVLDDEVTAAGQRDDVTDEGRGNEEGVDAVTAFNDRLKEDGHWVFAGGLGAPSTATVIDNRDGDAVITDGPFMESKEFLGGLWVLKAADLDEALKLAGEASGCCNRRVEVRPFADV